MKVQSHSASNQYCNPIANIRSSDADAIAEANLNRDATANQSSPFGTSASSQNLGSLPNRQRSSNTPRNDQRPFRKTALDSTDTTNNHSNNHSPQQDENAMLTNFDMDVSPIVSGGSEHMHSENASPQTMNSSSNQSNPAFTPPSMEQTSMGGQFNNSAAKNSMDPSLIDFSTGLDGFSNNGNVSFSPFFDSNAMNTGMDSLGMENPLPLNENWGGAAQNSGIANNGFGDMMGNTNNFSERQFDLLLQGMGWNGWNDQT